ncbi:MAG: succinate-semialdehyde dehydrogenase/glutarate-semialdehyde dehydrogenase, partial [Gammaproteobacteria bacterium]
ASATDVGRQIQAGMIGINSGVGAGGDTPWVGAKQSGYGFHGSTDGHRQFTQVRVIS